MYFARKPKPPKMGLREPNHRVSDKHRRWIRSLACLVKGCQSRQIEVAHVRSGLPEGEQAGIARKPGDWWTVPLCHQHHVGEQHAIGEAAFEKKYGLDLVAKARALALQSPDRRIVERARGLKL